MTPNPPLDRNAQPPSEDALQAFAPRIRDLLGRHRDRHQLSTIARNLGCDVSRLEEMLTLDETGAYRRRVTPYHLARFIECGIMSVEEVLGDRNLDELDDWLRLFFERMLLPRSTIRRVVQAREQGIDVDRLLESMLASGQTSP